MEVQLISCTEKPIYISSLAAKLKDTKNDISLENVLANTSEHEEMYEYIQAELNNENTSILEHVMFTFYVSRLSLLSESFLTSHRLATCVM